MSQDNTNTTTTEKVVIDYDARKKQLECEKLEMEKDKLELEIKYLRKPLRNPANIAPFTTLIAGSFAIIAAVYTGWIRIKTDEVSLYVQRVDSNLDHLTNMIYKKDTSKSRDVLIAILKDSVEERKLREVEKLHNKLPLVRSN